MRIARITDYNPNDVTDSEELELELSEDIQYSDDLEVFKNEKAFKQFLIRLKFYIRNSYEYKELIKFLKEYRGMDKCGVHPNVKWRDGFSIHIHHTPFTMEDICYTIITKRREENESLKMSDIAQEVMQLHYLGLVGLYPLCETCHEYAHSDANDLFIPLNKIYGDPESFVDIYQKYLEDSPLMNKFQNILVLNKGYNLLEQVVPMSLRKKYIYVRMKSPKKNDDAHYIVSNKKLYDLLNSDQLNKLLDSCIE